MSLSENYNAACSLGSTYKFYYHLEDGKFSGLGAGRDLCADRQKLLADSWQFGAQFLLAVDLLLTRSGVGSPGLDGSGLAGTATSMQVSTFPRLQRNK